MTHSLLSYHLQKQLMAAAATERLDVLDAVITSVQQAAPHKFHTEESLKKRVFLDQPRGHYSGSFIIAASTRI